MLGLHVAAPLVEGEATAGLVALLAKSLKVRRSDITLASGEMARLKLVHLTGEGPALAAKIEAWLFVVRSETRPH